MLSFNKQQRQPVWERRANMYLWRRCSDHICAMHVAVFVHTIYDMYTLQKKSHELTPTLGDRVFAWVMATSGCKSRKVTHRSAEG
jgi:hypothetical protein